MALARSVTSLEDVPEAIRNEYRQDGDKWVLPPLEGDEDLSGLKKNAERLLQEKKKVQADLQAERDRWKDLDPDKAREALTRLQELEEKQMIDKGEYDKLSEKRWESERKPLQAKIAELETALAARDAKEKELTEKYIHTERKGMLHKALVDARVDPKWAEFVEMKAERVWKWQTDDDTKEGHLVPLENDEPIFVDGKLADMKTWITGVLAKNQPDILLPSTGGAANGNHGRSGTPAFFISRDLAKDQRAVERIIADAAKAGVPVSYEGM